MNVNLIDIIKHLELDYPKETAYDWDNVGLQIGNANQRAKKVLITLDCTKEVVKEAIHLKADMILSHHPLIFKPISSITIDTPRGWTILNLIKHNIALYAMHTNFDVSDGGMNDVFCDLLGVQNRSLLDDQEGIGRIGDINPMSFDDFVAHLRQTFSIDAIRLIGSKRETISKVAMSLGSGSHHMNPAKKKNADVFLTGDVTYHTAIDAIQMGLTILDIGHSAEKIFQTYLQNRLSKTFPDVEFVVSSVHPDPFVIL